MPNRTSSRIQDILPTPENVVAAAFPGQVWYRVAVILAGSLFALVLFNARILYTKAETLAHLDKNLTLLQKSVETLNEVVKDHNAHLLTSMENTARLQEKFSSYERRLQVIEDYLSRRSSGLEK